MQDMYEVIKIPHAMLKEKAHKIENIDADIKDQAERMVQTMYRDSGIGLAANQVNILNRMFVMDLPENIWNYTGEKNGIKVIEAGYRSGEREEELVKNPTVFINPEIVWESEAKSVYEEGCLSIPGQYAEVVRPCDIKVRFQNAQGTTEVKEYSGLHAHCVQHEIDHLNGVLFIDYLSSLKRNMILKKMKKLQKDATAL
ncbi:MAG: peptide deformylase [Pseudomonadota bacterium]